jgi:peroxiredoxin
MSKKQFLHRWAQILLKGVIIFFGIILSNADFAYTMDLGRHRATEPQGEFLRAMDFTLPDLSGNPVSLKDFEGKSVVLLVFWVSRCEICRGEVPLLNEIYDKYKDKGVEILAVNIGERQERVERFKNTEGIRYPVLLDSDRRVGRLYHVFGVPTEVIVDRQGNVRYYDFGVPYNWEEILEGLIK